MARPESFEQRETRIFEENFPMDELRKIQNKENRLLDPFKTLSNYGFCVKDTKEARDIVLAEISQTRFGPQINMIDSEHGIRIYGKDIIPFLKAATEIYLNTIDLWTDEAKKEFDKIFS